MRIFIILLFITAAFSTDFKEKYDIPEDLNINTAIDSLKNKKDVLGKEVPKMNIPTRTITRVDDPLERAEQANVKDIEDKKKKMEKSSLNMAKLYEFLSLYGMMPRKDGDLKNEKELFQLIDSGQISVKSKTIFK